MKCRQAQDLIGAYIYGDLAPEEMRDLRLHAQECALCREDLASRGRIISSLDDNVPELTDEERQRIAWSVKGAVRKEQFQQKPFMLRLVPTFAVAGVLIAGILVGRHMLTRTEPSHSRMAKDLKNPKVQVQELPAPDKNADPTQVADQISQLLQNLAAPNYPGAMIQPDRNTLPGRAWSPDRRMIVAPENVFVVPQDKIPATPPPADQQPAPDTNMVNPPKDSTPAVNNTDTGTDSEAATQLPRVTDPKNAETTPEENK